MKKKKSHLLDNLNLDHVPFESLMKFEKNVYKVVNIIAERAKELNTKSTHNLHKLLEDFGSTQEDAVEICRVHDRKKKTHLEALEEYLKGHLQVQKKEI